MNVGQKLSHQGKLARLTGPAHLHMNSALVIKSTPVKK